jgi:hypothetical protein
LTCRRDVAAFYRIENASGKGPAVLKLFATIMFSVLLGTAPALAAVEQCRFIQAKPDREACYERQAAALAAKHEAEATRASGNTKSMESLEQMKHEDEALNLQLHSICRGC